MPLWAKYVLTLCVAVPLAAIAFIWFHDQTSAPPAEAPSAVVSSNEATRAEVELDQGVHRATSPRSMPAAAALEAAILTDVRSNIAHNVIDGPAGKVSCHPLGRPSGARLAFSCTAVAGGGFGYPFRGVVDERTGALAWCKDDYVAAGGDINVPLSPACT
jgi:hypothetical protein